MATTLQANKQQNQTPQTTPPPKTRPQKTLNKNKIKTNKKHHHLSTNILEPMSPQQ